MVGDDGYERGGGTASLFRGRGFAHLRWHRDQRAPPRRALLTDPNFLHRGQRVYLGYGLFSKRRTEPAMQPAELPPLDGVVLSHLHGDHFDRVAREDLAPDLPIVTTPHAARRLGRWGFVESVPLGTWESHEFEGVGERVRITSVPGTHGPGVVGRLLPPVMGTVIELLRGDDTALRI